MPKHARRMSCKICEKDLTAKAAPGTKALRAPLRVEISFAFGGFVPPRPYLSIALCASCAERVTFSSNGIPFLLDVPPEKGD